jgi:ammonium transporter, Amt family
MPSMKNLSIKGTFNLFVALAALTLPETAFASNGLDSGDTAWMLISTALVLFMTLPGLALFYGGLVRTKNVLSVLMQCFSIAALITVLWVICGYSLAFDASGMSLNVQGRTAFIGGFANNFLKEVTLNSLSGSIPESVFVMFQLTFAIITSALIVGAIAERMKFSALLLFSGLWSLVVYAPICHMVWSGDGSFLGDKGLIDFAGGTVVHVNAGVSALVAAIIIGKRTGYGSSAPAPHNVTIVFMGASMLWVGWFGLNAGNAVAADGTAGMAMLVTQVCTATAAFTWMLIDWVKNGKPGMVNVATGAVAGLVAITPASGTVGTMGALLIGVLAAAICYWACHQLKASIGYDDALDVFGIHAIGGAVGTLATGIFSAAPFGGSVNGLNVSAQLGTQFIGVVVTAIYASVVTAILLKVIDGIVGLRVSQSDEKMGLDESLHDEQAYET